MSLYYFLIPLTVVLALVIWTVATKAKNNREVQKIIELQRAEEVAAELRSRCKHHTFATKAEARETLRGLNSR